MTPCVTAANLREWADCIDQTRRFGARVPIGKRFIMAATLRTVADSIERRGRRA